MSRKLVTAEQYKAAYAVAVRVFEKMINATQGARELSAQYEINETSAHDFIRDYGYMRTGKRITRGMSVDAANYFVMHIYAAQGKDGLRTAMKSVDGWIKYQESASPRSKGSRPTKLAALYDQMQQLLAEKPRPLAEIHDDLERKVEQSARESRVDRLRRLSHAAKSPQSVEAITRVYLRNPDVVVEVLLRARGFCEGCGKRAPFKRRKDGTPYLEVHHIQQLAHGGEDTVENAVALCPNCHRHRHFGKTDDSVR